MYDVCCIPQTKPCTAWTSLLYSCCVTDLRVIQSKWIPVRTSLHPGHKKYNTIFPIVRE